MKDEQKLEFETSHEVKVITSFDALKLKEDLLRGIYAYSTFIRVLSRSSWQISKNLLLSSSVPSFRLCLVVM